MMAVMLGVFLGSAALIALLLRDKGDFEDLFFFAGCPNCPDFIAGTPITRLWAMHSDGDLISGQS